VNYRIFPAGHMPFSVAERLSAISDQNAEAVTLLIAEFWKAYRDRDFERADRLSVHMAPYLDPAPANPIARITGGTAGHIFLDEVQFVGL